MKVKGYNPGKIEPKWRKEWEGKGIFSPDLERAKKPFYNLMMFPYPSAEGLHVGNMYAFTGADIYGRFMRLQGYDVFEPIGLDGFGIHSENYALSIGEHPAKVAQRTQKNFYRQLRATGNAYDWIRTLETYDPDYYKWTQWIFVQMFKRGLAYKGSAMVNWCPSCKTVLADEQVIAGKCERCGTFVGRRPMRSWFFRITKYADRLLENLEKINWPQKIKTAQRQWIGKSEGALVNWKIKDIQKDVSISTFTTRLDTIFGVTFLVLAPEHEAIDNYFPASKEVKNFVTESLAKTEQARKIGKEGIFTGYYAIHPLTGEEIPIWIGEFVLEDYGTGAVMGVPYYDERDQAFAKEHKLPIKKVKLATKKQTEPLFKKKFAQKHTGYHLRDWLISRQRYWGPPIPMIFCGTCQAKGRGERNDMPGWYTAPEKDLPVKLPYIKDYQPKGTGEAPLAQDKKWVRVACPGCGSTAQRETDVSDTFLDSSWYFLGYLILGNHKSQITNLKLSLAKRRAWLPVDMYIGGAEHAVLHLMYARFITMVFKDWGLIDFEEPFERFYAHGLLIAEGAKMSKSRGNIVIPDEYIKKFGADTLRSYLMFLGPFDQGGDFRDTGIEGMYRFVKRVWDLVTNWGDVVLVEADDTREVLQAQHRTIKKVTEDLQNLRYNTAISHLMEFVNVLREKTKGNIKRAKGGIRCAEWDEAIRTLVLLSAPIMPHITEELWVEALGQDFSVHQAHWPKYSEELVAEEAVTIAIQVNGKLRDTVVVPANKANKKEFVDQLARKSERVSRFIAGNKIKQTVFVPGKLLNFVTI